MDEELSFYEQKKLVEQKRIESELKRKQASKEKLRSSLTTHLKTVMIGAVCAFEEDYNELWGGDVEDIDVTPEQEDEYKLWQKVRKKILDIGNLHIRKCLEELDNYEINYAPPKVTINLS